ncbi:hypothetical protein B0H10DRAFT_2034921 [Mycena sp. CBHHK59/15]|nr:hypothetical protein B0H10DRAFT_2034921 [Mycena sp. CBHHK59/15]
MSIYDLQVLDTLETPDYLKGELSTDGQLFSHLDIPAHMVPPDPDDSDILPSQAHPSYPYGNPTNVKHPASRPRPPYDPSSRALFEDMGYAGGVSTYLLPVDEEKEELKRAVEARKMASGASNTTAPQPGMGQDQTVDDEEEEENDENENDDDDEEDSEGNTEGDEDSG